MSSENSTEEIPIYTFGKMSFKDLEHIVNIKKNIVTKVFYNQFEAEIQIKMETEG